MTTSWPSVPPGRTCILILCLIVRLTPVYALVLMVFSTLTRYWSSGPLWMQLKPLVFDNCKEVWWTHLLYVNSYVMIDKPVSMEQTISILRNVKHLVDLSRTSTARTPMTNSNSFLSPRNSSDSSRKQIIKEIFLFYHQIVCCV